MAQTNVLLDAAVFATAWFLPYNSLSYCKVLIIQPYVRMKVRTVSAQNWEHQGYKRKQKQWLRKITLKYSAHIAFRPLSEEISYLAENF